MTIKDAIIGYAIGLLILGINLGLTILVCEVLK